MAPTIRPAQQDDLAAVLALWRQADAEPTHTDDLHSLAQLLAHDPHALLLAEETDKIVGSVIAGWDGWRGSIYRLAVTPSHRRHGLGQRLLHAAEDRLRTAGARRLQAIVVETDSRATRFWRTTDWTEQVERLRFTHE
jgi:ribosomal protein S18 acetylase RimI-like enzyme